MSNIPPNEAAEGPPSARDLRWTLEPVEILEDLPLADLFILDEVNLRRYAFDLQRELRSVRRVMHEAVHAVALVRALRQQLRQARR